jgi:riboflavin kinase, archaea type
MVLQGRIQSGKGDFGYWLKKLERYYTAKTGMKLWPGTLNVHLIEGSFAIPAGAMRLEKEEYGGSVSVSIVRCRVMGREAFILRTDTDEGKCGDPPEKILEIATDAGLRELYNLEDGDVIDVEV